MTAFYIGEGLSGLIPGIVGLIQGVGSNPECKNVSFVVHNSTTGQNYTEYKIGGCLPPTSVLSGSFLFLLIRNASSLRHGIYLPELWIILQERNGDRRRKEI